MKKEIIYRIMRILLVITILLVGSFLRNEVKESYEMNENIIKQLSTNLELTKLDEKIISQNSKLTSSYILEVKNNTDIEKDFSFEILSEENNINCINYDNVKYQVLKNNIVLKEGSLKDTNNLYNGVQKANSKEIYQINFLIDKSNTTNKKFLAKITLI